MPEQHFLRWFVAEIVTSGELVICAYLAAATLLQAVNEVLADCAVEGVKVSRVTLGVVHAFDTQGARDEVRAGAWQHGPEDFLLEFPGVAPRKG